MFLLDWCRLGLSRLVPVPSLTRLEDVTPQNTSDHTGAMRTHRGSETSALWDDTGEADPKSRLVAIARTIVDSCADPVSLDTDLKAIDYFVQASIQLRNKKNAFVSLPAEILLEIIFLVRTCYTDRFSGKTSLHWIPPTTHVCRRLRAISISCPALWTDISQLSDTSLVSAMIERSGMLPLDVSFDLHTYSGGERRYAAYKLACERASHRFRELKLSIDSAQDPNGAPWHFHAPMPMLKSLDISVGGHGRQWLADPINPTPYLTTLDINSGVFNYSSSIYNNLVYLTIEELPCDTSQEFQELLTRMQHLIYLSMIEVGFPHDFYETKQRIVLPSNLTHVKVFFLEPNSASFMNHVDPSPNLQEAEVGTCAEWDDFSVEECGKIFRHCNFPSLPGSRNVRIKVSFTIYDEEQILRFCVQRALTPDRNDEPTLQPPLVSAVYLHLNSETAILPFNFELLPSDRALTNELFIDTRGVECYDKAHFHKLFGQLRNLRLLSFYWVESFTDLFDILFDNPEIFPRLHVLEIYQEAYIKGELDQNYFLLLEMWKEKREKMGYETVTLDLNAHANRPKWVDLYL